MNVVRNDLDPPIHPVRENIHEMPGQQWYIFGTLAQRRNGDGKNIEPIKQVFPELAFRNHLPQVVVGGGDQPHIGFDRLCAPQPLELMFLQNPQELRLQFGGYIADLIQK